MGTMYSKNKIHISKEEQKTIKDFSILIAGCGIGSYIAEFLLRLGFENITIIDGDDIELSNLNRQNYTTDDIGKSKVRTIRNRLLSINPRANIVIKSFYINESNLKDINNHYKVAINALDFDSDIPFLFDSHMLSFGVPVIHPFNLGWAGFITIVASTNENLQTLDKKYKKFELNAGQFILNSLKSKGINTLWLEHFLTRYAEVSAKESPPQLSIGLAILSGMVSHLIFDIATNKQIKTFPDFYYLSIKE